MVKSRIVIKSGLTKLDEMIGNLSGGELIVLAGIARDGEKALLYNIIRKSIEEVKKKPGVMYFTSDLNNCENAISRYISNGRVNYYRARGRLIKPGELRTLKKYDILSSYDPHVSIIDNAMLSSPTGLSYLRKKARAVNKKTKQQLMVVDSLYLGRSKKDKLFATMVCDSLKRLATQLNIPIITSCNTPWLAKRKKSSILSLEDLKEVCEIGKNADRILFVYLKGYYKGDTKRTGCPAQIIVAKNTNERVGAVDVKYTEEYWCFDNK